MNQLNKQLAPTSWSNDKVPIGISACLTGAEVRYNGGHSRSSFCMNDLAEYFEYQTFCPEVQAGFGTPRPTLRLEGDPEKPRLCYTQTHEDVTAQFQEAVTPCLSRFDNISGYILMKNSPSCGLERIKVYQDNGYAHEIKREGLFTEALMARYPELPVEESGRLCDQGLRENFILRVFAHHRFRQLVDNNLSYANIMAFHSEYKYTLMAHSQREYKALGRLVAEGKQRDLMAMRDEYFARFMAAIKKPASRGNHANVLLHLLGYLKRSVASEHRQRIVDVIAQYRDGEVNLATPLALLNHYLEFYGSDYVRMQRYLEPYPPNLGLRNYV
ncbi:MAG: YbgA family protein [Pontibacterium sp.]